MKNKETLISVWTDKLYKSGLNEYQAKKNALIIADEIEEIVTKLDKQSIAEFEYNLKESTSNIEGKKTFTKK